VFWRGTQTKGEVRLLGANIGGDLDCTGTSFENPAGVALDAQNLSVKGGLVWRSMEKRPVGIISLNYAKVGPLVDDIKSWPQEGNLRLEGFEYEALVGDSPQTATERLEKWLALQPKKPFNPQPYEQLAKVFRQMGHTVAVNAILYAGKERERHEAKGLKWWGLSVLKWVIGYGYGYRYFFSLFWVAAITLIGVGVLTTVDNGAPSTLAQKAAFSFDLLLPIIELDERHKIMFEGCQRYYFYLHQLLGFVLGSFVVAGLSGITKK